MYLFEYHQNPRLFWFTLAALVLLVIVLWPSTPKCADLHGQTWDYQVNQPIACR